MPAPLPARPFLLFIAALAPLAAEDWPQWRGIHRDGISPETGLLQSWPEGGPKLVWKTTGLGEGYSAFSVVKGRLYTQGQRGGQTYVMAFDTATGKKVWETPTGGAFEERRGNGPRGTPTYDEGRLYAMAGEGTLAALDAATGKKLWQVNVVKEYSGSIPHWGISESPLIDGPKVVVTPGGSGAGVVALDKLTGKPMWKSAGDPAAYSSPVVVERDGVRQYVTLTSRAAVGVSARNGEMLWRYDKVANRTANIATPIHSGGHVFVSTDYGTGGALLKLAPNGSASEVYFTREMRNHYSSCVLVDKHLYGFSSAVLTVMNFLTGEVAWRDRSVGKGSVTYADRRLYLLGETGVVGLAEATPEGYKERGRFSIPQGEYRTWTPPVIANGRLYLREQDNLYSYDIRVKP